MRLLRKKPPQGGEVSKANAWEKHIDRMNHASMLIGLAAIIIGTLSIILSLR